MERTLNIAIGVKTKDLREKKHKTIEKLAYENDIAKSTLSRIERGLIDARISTLKKIASGLEISLSVLLKDT